MLAFHPRNPYRPVNWRWQLACYCRDHPSRRNPPIRDAWHAEVLAFARTLKQCTGDIDRWHLMDEYPDLYGAYLVHLRGDPDAEVRHPLRHLIEARILAGQSVDDIASRVGLSVEVVRWFARVYFDVEDRLHNRDYVMTCVLGPSVYAGMTDRDYDLLWKLFGYLYGPCVLDAFIYSTTRQFRPENQAEVDAALAEDARSTLTRRAAVTARTFSINPFSQSELLGLYARLLEIEKSVGQDKGRDVIMQNISVMMDRLGQEFVVADDDKMPKNVKLLPYMSQAAELRAEELTGVLTGQTLDPEVVNLKFPEQPKNAKAKATK